MSALSTFCVWCEPLLTIASSCSLSSTVRVTMYFSIPRFSPKSPVFTTTCGTLHSTTVHACRDTSRQNQLFRADLIPRDRDERAALIFELYHFVIVIALRFVALDREAFPAVSAFTSFAHLFDRTSNLREDIHKRYLA